MDRDNKYLGTEKVGKLLRMFALPCILSLVIQALYNIVDQIFIGNCASLGELGNSATGVVYPLTVIALAFGLLLGDGTSAIMSINQGKNQTENTHKTIGCSIIYGAIISIILVIISFVFIDPILTFFAAKPAVMPFAKEYSVWIIIGFPFFLLASIINPIIRADGSPKYAMFSMILGAVINIILDPLFIFAFDMGMTGAALATCIAQIISFILSFVYLFKAKTFKLELKSFVPNFKLLIESSKLGISSFITQISIVVISIVNNNILGNLLPSDDSAIGLLTIAFKIFGIVVSIIIGIAVGGQPIIGYNYGAKKYDRVKEVYKMIMKVTIFVGVISTLLFTVCPKLLLRIFGYSNPSQFGINTLRIYLGFILLTCITKAISIFFQSIGMPVKSTIVSIMRDLLVLVPISLIFSLGGIDLFLWSAPVSDVVTFIVALVLIIKVLKTLKTNEVVNIEEDIKIRKSKQGIIITIAREHGAGGREIGKILANKLGIPFYDKEITMVAAQESGLSKEYIDNFVDNKTLMYNLYLSTEVNLSAISAQDKALKMIAENGSCVIVGRAADYVLKDYKPFKIMIYAPMEYKIKRVMTNYGDTEKQAKDNIERSNSRRAMYYKSITGQDWNNKNNYNLCIDSSIGVEQSADIIYNYISMLNK